MKINVTKVKNINQRFPLRKILATIVVLLACSIFLQSLKFVFHLQFTAMNFLIFLFNVDQERNIPTFFSVILLLSATWQLYSISIQKSEKKNKYRFHWWLMTILFFFVTADEFMATHEMISEIVRDKYHVTGFLYYAWVIPFAMLVGGLTILYTPFIFRHLPKQTRNLMIVSAVLYIGGAIFMEMVGGYFYLQGGTENMTNAFLTTIEEGMEMTGIAVFIYTLSQYKITMDRKSMEIVDKKRSASLPENPAIQQGKKAI